MLANCSNLLHRGTRIGLLGVAIFVALAWIGAGRGLSTYAPDPHVLPSLGDGVVGGVFVAGAAGAALMSWRRHPGRLTGWIVAAGALIAAQSLTVTLLALSSPPPGGPLTMTLLLLAAVVGLASVVTALSGLPQVGHVTDECFCIGLGMGLMASGYLLLQFPIASPAPFAVHAVTGVLVATHVLAVALAVRRGGLPPGMAGLLVATVLVVGLGLVVRSTGPTSSIEDLMVLLARAGVGATWLTLAWGALREAIEEDRRRINSAQQVLASATRDQRERLHELRSTVAGLVNGSSLLDNPSIPPETRQRLLDSVRRELGRMDRLLSCESAPPTDIDLDEALGLILDLQRLKGRHVELRSTGDVVRARYDELAEVVNILLDNAVTHGGSDNSVVEVVRRDEETVDITVTDFGRGIPAEQRTQIFEWGRRGQDSPGEGIGLHLAKRLVSENGGSLTLAEEPRVGSSFVISLPSVRRSPENHLTEEDGHAWRRSG